MDATRAPDQSSHSSGSRYAGDEQPVDRFDVAGGRRVHLLELLVRQPARAACPVAGFGSTPCEVEHRGEVLHGLADRLPLLPGSLTASRSEAATSSPVSESTVRSPRMGRTRSSATRCSTRVPSLTSTRLAFHCSPRPSPRVGAASAARRVAARSGTRDRRRALPRSSRDGSSLHA